MIDVVFLLLIFFLVTSSFVKAERQFHSGIQVEEKAAAASSSDIEQTIVDLVSKDGTFHYKVGSVMETEYSELLALLNRLPKKSGIAEQDAYVRAPDEAPFDMVASAEAACREAGFTSVTYVPLGD